MIELIRTHLPDGERFSIEDLADDDGLGTGPIKLRMTMWRDGDTLNVDSPRSPRAPRGHKHAQRAYVPKLARSRQVWGDKHGAALRSRRRVHLGEHRAGVAECLDAGRYSAPSTSRRIARPVSNSSSLMPLLRGCSQAVVIAPSIGSTAPVRYGGASARSQAANWAISFGYP